jgi:LmbE family N-acetylglucosaminyl deacetylase
MRILKRFALPLLLSVICQSFIPVQAQTTPTHTHVALNIHTYNSLQTCGSVLYIAAHPDDENTRLISWLVNEKHYRTGYLSLTRGDGGQNLIGTEQSENLGLIRTHELIEARKRDGAEQYFTRAYDFGYSKTPEETLKKWNRDSILSDMVWVIRKFRPDVIICRFPTTGEGGHGHHTASAILAEEAFEAAGNPEKFSWQLSFLQVWKPHRLLWNTFSFGNRNTTAPDQYKVNVGGYNPVLGKSYGEIAAEARSCHSSQAFGTARNRGEIMEYFKTIKGDAPVNDLLDGIPTDWNRFKDCAHIMSTITQLNHNTDFLMLKQNPIRQLIQLKKEIENAQQLPEVWKIYYLNKVRYLIQAATGIYAECTTATGTAAPGDSLNVQLQFVHRTLSTSIHLTSMTLAGQAFALDSLGMPGKVLQHTLPYQIPQNASYSQPYWLNAEVKDDMFYIGPGVFPGAAIAQPALSVELLLNIEGDTFTLNLPVQYKKIDPSKGEVYQPFYITPPMCVNFMSDVFIFHSDAAKTVDLKVYAYTAGQEGKIQLRLPDGWKAEPAFHSVTFKTPGQEQIVRFNIKPPAGARQNQKLPMFAEIQTGNQTLTVSDMRMSYPHIPELLRFPEAKAWITEIHAKHNLRAVGYIPGAGDKIPEFLQQMGIQTTTLSGTDLQNADLSQYDAIITGVRAWNTNTDLRAGKEALFQYIEKGGVCLIQYNTSHALVTPDIAPLPLKLTRDRVTDENAVVRITHETDPNLKYPNLITDADFRDWVQERGLYFPGETDPAYLKPLAMADPNETENPNAIIWAPYGKGKFVYTGLSFFRQLPSGVPGAARLFLNLLHPVNEK